MPEGVNARVILVLALVPYAAWLVFAYEYHFLDGVNLLFHEAGHVFFGLCGRTLGVMGGTLGQLVFPAVTTIDFARRGRPFEASVCLLWLGESLMYGAEYIGDARAMVLPLVGGHIHDWNWLLRRWGMLPHAELLGGMVHVLGSGVVVAALAGGLHFSRRPAPDDD